MKPQALNPAEERDVQMYAAAAARRNRPTLLLVFAALLLVGAVIFAGVSAGSARAARHELVTLAEDQAAVNDIADEIRRLRERSTDRQTDGRYSRELQLSKLEAINRRVTLPTAPTLQEQRPTRPLDSPIEKRRVDVTMENVPLEAAFEWINEAQRAIPDLFISAMELRPRPSGWTVRVQVARWELRS